MKTTLLRMEFRDLLRIEFTQRKERNPRYSLRAFALQLGTHHSTLSRIMAGRRRVTQRALRAFGSRIGLDTRRIAAACVEENASAILRLTRSARFRADSRWLAERSGLRLDEVNIAIHHLVWSGRIRMAAPSNWNTEVPWRTQQSSAGKS